MTKLAIAEDHTLFREVFSCMCTHLGYDVIITAKDGQELISHLENNILPDVIFMDVCMPNMSGRAATAYIAEHYPFIKVIAISAYVHQKHVIDMFKSGAKGYISKVLQHEAELSIAVDCVMSGDYYISEEILAACNISREHIFNNNFKTRLLNRKEYEFVSLCASDDSYQQIADKMKIAYRTVDCYRAAVFRKLGIQSRSGLALYAVVNGLSLDLANSAL